MFLSAPALMCASGLCLLILFVHRPALADVNGENVLGLNVNTTILGMEIATSINDTTEIIISPAQEKNIVDNRLLRDRRQGFHTPLHLAVSDRNIQEVTKHLNYGEGANPRGSDGLTPLMLAARTGDLDIVNLLISRNASLDMKDELENAAIHQAAKRGHIGVIEALLAHGADVDAKGNNGLTPLMLAIIEGDIDAVNLLIARNAKLEIKDEMNNAALHHAAMKRDLRVLKALLYNATNRKGKKNLLIRSLILSAWKNVNSNNKRNTSLKLKNDSPIIGLLGRSLQVFKAIIDLAVSVNSKGENGNTPLIFTLINEPNSGNLIFSKNINLEVKIAQDSAEEKEILAAMKILVEYGADVNSQNLIGRTALHEAAIRGFAHVVNFLLSQNASFEFEDNFCYTPFHWAANNSNIDLIKILLEYGDDINRKGCGNVTALHLAVERNDSNLLDFLLSNNADPNVMREDGRTPLDVAFQRSLVPFIKLLLDNGASVEDKSFLGSKVLFGAVANRSLDLLRLLLDKTVNFYSYPTVVLNYAIGTKFSEGTKLLVFYGANIEQKDIHGNVPLSSAVLSRSNDLVKLILETGARTIAKENIKTFLDAYSNLKVNSIFANVTEFHRLSPLHIAAYHGLNEITRLLISYGASLEVRDERKYTPLHYASENGHAETVKVLLDSGANKSATDIHGRAPIHLACKQGMPVIVQFLMLAPVDINMADNYGYTPLHFAAMNGSSEVVKLLLNFDADIEAKSNNLTVPLHLASLEGKKEVVKILLNAGAERDASDVDDMTPLHYAARERHPEIVRSLLRAKSFTFSSNKNGSSPLHLFCGSYNTRRKLRTKDELLGIIQAFEHYLLLTNDPDNDKMSVLHVAARDGSTTCVEQLLARDDLFADVRKNTPLHYAALNGHIEIIRMILKANGALLSKINTNHETPLLLASREGHTDAVALLLQGAVDDFRPDINGRTPLHRSACRGHIGIVKLLLSSMAKREAEDKWGFTPLNYAASWKGHQQVVGYLSTSQLDVTLSYYFNISDPFIRSTAKMTKFFI